MALVNIGVLLALTGKRVLLIDWDLEAPGLEVYFRRAAKLVGDPASIPGIVDLLEAHAAERDLDWRSCLLRAEFLTKSLDLISAGSRTPDYRKRVQQLDWDTLYKEHKIGNFINELRKEWRREYDFVLVDSRTGITDIGDICTVLLPDAIVLMFVTNYQNVEGIKTVMARAVSARGRLPDNRTKLHGIPLAARDEVNNEYDKSLEWRRIYAAELGYLYREWLPKEVQPEDALNKLFIPYVTNWSFGERIPVLENAQETQNPATIGSAYQRMANLLGNGLDWYSLEGKVTVGELQSTQMDLLRERERAKELELHAIQATRKSRVLLWVALAAILLLLLGGGWFVYRRLSAVPPVSTELLDGIQLYNDDKSSEALKIFQARAALLANRLKTSPDDPLVLKDAGNTNKWLGDALARVGRPEDALAAYQVSRLARGQVVKKTPDDQEALLDLSSVDIDIGDVLVGLNRSDEALTSYQSSKALADKLVIQDASNAKFQKQVSASNNRIGNALDDQGKFDKALASFLSPEAIFRKLVSESPQDHDFQREYATAQQRVGSMLLAQGKIQEALTEFRPSQATLLQLVENDRSNAEWQADLAYADLEMGDALEANGKLDEALASFRSSQEILKALTKRDALNEDWQNQWALSYQRIGRVLRKQGLLNDALVSYQTSLGILERLTRQDPANQNLRENLANTHVGFAIVLRSQNDPKRAQSELTAASSILSVLRPTRLGRRLQIQTYRETADTKLIAADTQGAMTSLQQAQDAFNSVKIEKGAENYWLPERVRNLIVKAEILRKTGSADLNQALQTARPILDQLIKSSPGNANLEQDLKRLNSAAK